jgi:two-component system, NarL family, nitrate/nitrite response regulator NarL
MSRDGGGCDVTDTDYTLLDGHAGVDRLVVVLALRNELARYGIERMLQSVDSVVEHHSYDDLDVAAKVAAQVRAAGEPGSVVLVTALSEIDDTTHPGVEAAAERGVKTLFVVDDVDRRKLRRVARADGSGFVFADELGAGTLAVTLERLHAGEMPISTRLTRVLLTSVGDVRGPDEAGREVRLTAREREVLGLLVDGLSNKQIARQLGITQHGAKRHVANIMAKLNCPNRTLAVSKALREGLCPPPS